MKRAVKKLKLPKPFLVTTLLLLATGLLLVISVLSNRQTVNSHAAGGTIDHIIISYPPSTMTVTDPPYYFSAQAVDSLGQPVSGTTYTWGISSPVSLGRLVETNQNLTGFKPMNVGSGDIFVTAIQSGKTVTASFKEYVIAGANTTITPSPSQNNPYFVLATKVYLHGRGYGGDNANPTGTGNLSPKHTQIPFTLTFYDSTGAVAGTFSSNPGGEMNYDPASGSYLLYSSPTITLPSNYYSISVKVADYLQKKFSGFTLLQGGKSYTLPAIYLTAGDTNNDNRLDILDYNEILDCYSDLTPANNCDITKFAATDLNDDGVVNQIDYNLFIRELSVQSGQ